MDRSRWEGLRSANDGMRSHVDHLFQAYEQQRALLGDIRRQLSEVRTHARSSDGLVEATVDVSGLVTDLRLDPRAQCETAQDLSRTITETIREAARLAQQQASEMLAPIEAIVGGIPDLPDLMSGAPSLRDPNPSVSDESASGTADIDDERVD
ncbi:YbaB/EbfC family nucleoid-associated protein [Nocardia sp. CA-135953]|uniref:YbaB/EbfC family nucleoid-associated protein n=1 Tax=Nocardia sp. CA-135953 TaxID=3239978 RepID=UPI003D97A531